MSSIDFIARTTFKYSKARHEFVEKQIRACYGLSDEKVGEIMKCPVTWMQEQDITSEDIGEKIQYLEQLFDKHCHPFRQEES